ncbi:MAG: HAD family hydrolase [Clostridia bacterium]|nr:HAD family hydrolase [Clostridia bacterium]
MESKIYVFDMDDTLVDSHLRYTEGILQVLDEEGISYDADTLIPILNPLGFPKSAAYYSRLGVPGTPKEIVERMLDTMQRLYETRVPLFDGVLPYLEKRKAEGARLFLLTATPHRVSDACLRANGIFDFFEQVWCTEDFGYTKGDTALFLKMAEAIGCEPKDVLYFDDGVTAIRTARGAGMRTCGVLTPLAVESEGLTEAADTCIVSFKELL